MSKSDDELLAALKEAGHQEAATALEQKMTAQAAVAAAAQAGEAGEGGEGGAAEGGGAEARAAELKAAGIEPVGVYRMRTAQRKEGYPGE